MPSVSFTQKQKITLAITFVLAWLITWVADSAIASKTSVTIFSAQAELDEQGNLTFVQFDTSSSTDFRTGIIQLSFVEEYSGWPFSTSFLHAYTRLKPENYFRPSKDYKLLKQTILASSDQAAIDAINGVFHPPRTLYLGLICNTLLWWIVSYISITFILALARGINRATHIPKELVQQNRAMKGLCPHCSYDLRGLDEDQLCPECGKKPSEIAVTEAKKNPIDDEETDKDDAANVSCE